MARSKGSISISNNIEPKMAAPLDARLLTKDLQELVNPDSWPYYYIGMETYVISEQKWYTLRYGSPTDINNWVENGTGKDGEDGSPVEVDGVTKVGRENIITLVWKDTEGADHTIDVSVLDGLQGEIGPVGPQGPKGDDGRSFTISAMYDSEEDLREAHPTGEEGDAYLVGNETDTPDFWFWDTLINDWHNAGALAGAKGDKGDKGDQGDTPEITVAENGPDVYKLRITIGETSFVTANLKGKDGEGAPDENFSPTSRHSVENRTITARFEEVQDKQLSSPITIGETTATTVEDALTALNEKAVDVDDTTDITSDNPISNKATTTELNKKQNKTLTTPMDVGGTTATTVEDALAALNNKTVDVDSEISSTSTNPLQNKVVKTELDKKVDKTKIGVANGVAELDAEGKVPASQLPSFVDDVMECYYDPDTEKMYENKDITDPEHPIYSDEITPESGKIYIDKDGNDSYRWTGSMYASVGSANALTLGETSATAYRGDRGKIAYDDSQANKANIGALNDLTTTDKSNLVSAINELDASVDGITSDLSNKVDKVTGKGLSTNDYDNTEKTEVAKVKDKQDKNLSSAVTVGTEQKATVEAAITALANLSTYNAGSKLDSLAVADVFDAEAEYSADDYVIYNSRLYKALVSHTGAWNSQDFEEKQVMDEIISAAVSDYDSLLNRPQIAGITLTGNKTYTQLGIQPLENGKGLSTNDYDNASKAIVDGVTAALANKVDKVSGKGLSTNDYDDTEKIKVTNATTHISQKVTDADGVHGFKVTSVSEDEDLLYYKSGDDWKQIQIGSVTQLTEMPTPAAKYNGKIYQYVGTTTTDFKKGYFYECVNSAGSYSWLPTRVQSGGGQTIQYDVIPTPESKLVGSLIQYTGQTIQDSYQHGYFYECVSHEEEVEGETVTTYTWEQKNVQTGGDSRIKEEITEIGVKFDDGLRPYVKVDISKIIPPFADATWDDIAMISDLYYSGDASLEDIQSVWNVGDSKDILVSAMLATGVSETHAAQTVTMYLADFNHDTLTNAINGKEKSLLTFSFILNEIGQMNTSGSDSGGTSYGNNGGWKSSARRTWCNNVCIEALPSELKSLVKRVIRTTDKGSCSQESQISNDLLFIPSSKELVGSVLQPSGFNTYSAGVDSGTQYEMYKTDYPPTVNVYTSVTNGGKKPSWSYSYYSSYWLSITPSKGGEYTRGDYMNGLFIHGCI